VSRLVARKKTAVAPEAVEMNWHETDNTFSSGSLCASAWTPPWRPGAGGAAVGKQPRLRHNATGSGRDRLLLPMPGSERGGTIDDPLAASNF